MSVKRCLLLLNLITGLALPALLLGRPADARTVAVFSFGDAALVIAAADGRIVAPGTYPSIVLASSDNADFVDRLYQSGAILVADASLAFGCSTNIKSGSAQ